MSKEVRFSEDFIVLAGRKGVVPFYNSEISASNRNNPENLTKKTIGMRKLEKELGDVDIRTVLRYLYNKRYLSTTQIAEALSLSGASVACDWLVRAEIPRRSRRLGKQIDRPVR